jgi:hypothetical protein
MLAQLSFCGTALFDQVYTPPGFDTRCGEKETPHDRIADIERSAHPTPSATY